jgi:ankyrin repeat protein
MSTAGTAGGSGGDLWTQARVNGVVSAADKGHWVEVALALDAGFPVNAQDGSEGARVLHWVAYHCHAPLLTRLLAAGADVNARDGGGETPAHFAVRAGHVAALAALVEAGADVNAADGSGATVLFRATDSLPWPAAPACPAGGGPGRRQPVRSHR